MVLSAIRGLLPLPVGCYRCPWVVTHGCVPSAPTELVVLWAVTRNEKLCGFALTVNTSLLVIHILVVEVEDADGHVVGLLGGTFRVAGDGL